MEPVHSNDVPVPLLCRPRCVALCAVSDETEVPKSGPRSTQSFPAGKGKAKLPRSRTGVSAVPTDDGASEDSEGGGIQGKGHSSPVKPSTTPAKPSPLGAKAVSSAALPTASSTGGGGSGGPIGSVEGSGAGAKGSARGGKTPTVAPSPLQQYVCACRPCVFVHTLLRQSA